MNAALTVSEVEERSLGNIKHACSVARPLSPVSACMFDEVLQKLSAIETQVGRINAEVGHLSKLSYEPVHSELQGTIAICVELFSRAHFLVQDKVGECFVAAVEVSLVEPTLGGGGLEGGGGGGRSY